jgi:hypothetical protein
MEQESSSQVHSLGANQTKRQLFFFVSASTQLTLANAESFGGASKQLLT